MKAIQNRREGRLFSVGIAHTVILTILFLLPLLYIEGYRSYTSLRYYFFGTAALILGISTLWTWFSAHWVPYTFFKTGQGYGLIIYVAVFGIASIASVDRVTSFFSTFQRTDGMFTIVFITLFALSTYTLIAIRGKKTLYSMLGASVLGATVVALFIMLSPDGIGTWFTEARGGATIGNSSVAGTYVLFNIFFAAMLVVQSRKKRVWWSIATGTLLIAPLFVNWHVLMGKAPFSSMASLIGTARGAVMGIVFGAIIAMATYLALQQSTVKRSIGSALLVLVLGATIVGGAMLLNPATAIHQGFVDSASSMRFIFWDIAWQGFTERPVVGWGPGTFDTVYHTLYRPEMLLQLYGGEMWVDRTHNLFFESLVTGGILLTGALIFFLTTIVAGLVRAVHRGYFSAIQGSLLMGALSGWLFQAQFVFESILSLAMLFLLAGISYGASATFPENTKQTNPSESQKLLFYFFVAVSVTLFVIAIALPYAKDRLMYKTFNTSLPARASMWQKLDGITPMGDGYDSVLMFNKVYQSYNASAESLRSEDVQMKQAVLDELDAVSTYLLQLSEERKKDYGIHLMGEQLFYLRMRIANDFTGQPLQGAQTLAVKARELSPTDPQAYWIQSQLQTVSHDLMGAKQTLEQALLLEPKLATTHQFILRTARNMRDDAYYQSSLLRAQRLIPDFIPEI